MKKQYINPQTEVVSIQVQSNMLTGSTGVSLSSGGDVESVGFGGDYDGSSDIKSRGGLWED